MIKLVDILQEVSYNNGSTGGADAGEPDTGWTNPKKKRILGVKAGDCDADICLYYSRSRFLS